jgi:hypothetical protein
VFAATWIVLGVFVAGAYGQSTPRQVKGDTPARVATGRVAVKGHHDPANRLKINVGLAPRDSAGLDAVIRAASTPGSPDYGHYLTEAQYMASYAPTTADVNAARSWLRSQGLTVTGVSRDNLLVSVRATSGRAERAFGVTINDYRSGGREFYSNDRDPSVPENLDVKWVSGLQNSDVIKPTRSGAFGEGGLDGGDFRTAYDVSGTGAGETIGFTLWGGELPQSDYDGYASHTGTTPLTVGGAGAGGLTFNDIGGSSTERDTNPEVALDTDNAHAVAPLAHETYWLGVDNSFPTLEDVVNQAANSGLAVVSNSWGCFGCSIDFNMETSLQHAASVGTSFYFATGDFGASAGRSYPSGSQYVVAVGGTDLFLGRSSNWAGEDSWAGSGGACDNSEPRPSWQTGIFNPLVYPSAPCTGRAQPDVAADSGTCGYTFVGGAESCFTGTSLATPLWAAMSAVWNSNNVASGRPRLGFSAPLIYTLANDTTAYPRDFHDITRDEFDFGCSCVGNGFPAGPGWDEVTGWGSPDLNKLSNNPVDILYTGPTSATNGATIALSGVLDEHFGQLLSGRTMSFSVGAESCSAQTNNSGRASCNVTISDPKGVYSVSAGFAGDAAFQAKTVTNSMVVQPRTTTQVASSANPSFGEPVTFTATVGEPGGSGTPTGTVQFSVDGTPVGTAVTLDASGQATYTTSTLAVGSHTVSAAYSSDETSVADSSGSTTQQVLHDGTPPISQVTLFPPGLLTPDRYLALCGTAAGDICGVATDIGGGSGVQKVEVRIERTSDSSYWDGSTWVSGETWVQATGTLQFSLPFTPDPGTYLVTPRATDNAGNVQTALRPATLAIRLATATQLGSSANPSAVAQQVTYTATVSPVPDGGTMAFKDNGAAITDCASQPVDTTTGAATCRVTYTDPATHPITATYSGNFTYAGAVSSPLSEVVNKAGSMTTVDCSGTPFTYSGSAQGCTASWATMSADTGGGPVTPVTYSGRNATTYGPLTTAPTNAGDYAASATFGGDANHTGSSDSKDFSINKAGSTTSVACTGSPFTYSGSAQGCTASWATMSADTGGGPVTPVTYSGRNATTYGPLTTAPTNAGDYAASATFGGDANHTGSSSSVNFSINKANPTCTISGYTVTYDGSSHTASGSCTGVGGSSLSGLDKSATTHTAPGTYNNDAWTFTDSAGNYNNTSGTINDQINKAGTGTSLASSLNPSMQAQSVTFTATVSVTAPGAGSVSGSVSFIDGTTTLGAAPVSTTNGVSTARLTISSLALRGHSLTAVYGGSGTLQGSTSSPVSQNVDTNLVGFPKLSNGAYNLTGAKLSGAYLVQANLAGANVSQATLTNANLTGANLSNANLSQVNLSGANLTGANLSGANLNQSNLKQATGMKTATLTNVTWNGTTCPDGTNSTKDGGTCLGHL